VRGPHQKQTGDQGSGLTEVFHFRRIIDSSGHEGEIEAGILQDAGAPKGLVLLQLKYSHL
jgi:hypothetical protein